LAFILTSDNVYCEKEQAAVDQSPGRYLTYRNFSVSASLWDSGKMWLEGFILKLE